MIHSLYNYNLTCFYCKNISHWKYWSLAWQYPKCPNCGTTKKGNCHRVDDRFITVNFSMSSEYVNENETHDPRN